MPPKLLRRIDLAAKRVGTTRSEFIARVMEEHLEGAEHVIKAMANPVVRASMLGALSTPGVLKAIGESLGADLKASERQQVLEFLKPGKGE